MSIIKTGISAIGKLLIVVALAGTFLVGAISVFYLSLRGDAVKVPEVVGKDFYASENEMAALGLKLKKRATRYSQEKPNTVLEQLPKAGETVKTGQIISVVTSEANPEDSEAPATLQKDTVDQPDESTDVTPEKPLISNKNSNTKKPSVKTRDVISNKSNKNANVNSTGDAAMAGNEANKENKTESGSNKKGGNKNSSAPVNKSEPATNPTKSEPVKSNPAKPAAAKTPATNGETRTRKVQQP
ncbi:MAG: PASTA domain-containing protein [Pyrinomonadaceae bacterium]